MVEALLKQLEASLKNTLEFFRPKDAFSWQTLFLLGLFSWGMAVLSVEGFELEPGMALPAATWVLFTMGWIFVTTAIGWGMVNQVIKVPLLDIKIKPAIWITSGLTSAFAFQIWNPSTRAIAIVSWPIVFALFSAFPQFIVVSENKFKVPSPSVRQKILITTLVCLLVSSWLQVHFVVQDWVMNQYPTLRAGNFTSSTFVVQLGDPPPVLDIAEQTVSETLRPRPIPEVRGWLVRVADEVPSLNAQFRRSLIDEQLNSQWLLNVAAETIYDPVFRLQVFPLVSALEAENEAPLRDAEEREEAEEEEGPLTPEERLAPRSARIGLERRCRILAAEDALEERDNSDDSADEPESEREPDSSPEAEPEALGSSVLSLVSSTPSSDGPAPSIRGADDPSGGSQLDTDPDIRPNIRPDIEPNEQSPAEEAPPPTADRSQVVCDRSMTLISRRGS